MKTKGKRRQWGKSHGRERLVKDGGWGRGLRGCLLRATCRKSIVRNNETCRMPHAAQCFSRSVSVSFVSFEREREREASQEASNDVQHAQNVLMSRTATRGRVEGGTGSGSNRYSNSLGRLSLMSCAWQTCCPPARNIQNDTKFRLKHNLRYAPRQRQTQPQTCSCSCGKLHKRPYSRRGAWLLCNRSKLSQGDAS